MGASRHDQFRVVAAVCQLLATILFVPLLATGQNTPLIIGIGVLLLPVPFVIYLWLRLDGKPSLFGLFTFVGAAWRVFEALWLLLIRGAFPLDRPVVALDVTYVALVSVAWYWLLFRHGRGDPALPWLFATFWARVAGAIAAAVLAASNSPYTQVGALSAWASLVAAIWLWAWGAIVSWRLITEARALPSL